MGSERKIASGVFWTTLVNIVNGVYGFISVPILLACYGKSDYGLIALAMSVNVYLRLMDLGFNSTNVRFFSNWLAKKDTGKTLYILDEPTTGLHFEDIRTLMQVLNRLIDKGNTVIVIEHNLDVIKLADHIIDMGPEGGQQGGTVIVTGTPESVARSGKGITSEFLKKEL